MRRSNFTARSRSARPTSAPWRSAHSRWVRWMLLSTLPGRGQAGQFRTAMARIRLVGDEPVAFEQIGDTLDALSGEPKAPSNLRDRPGAALEGLKHEPARERWPSDLASSSPVLVKYSASRITSTRTS